MDLSFINNYFMINEIKDICLHFSNFCKNTLILKNSSNVAIISYHI